MKDKLIYLNKLTKYLIVYYIVTSILLASLYDDNYLEGLSIMLYPNKEYLMKGWHLFCPPFVCWIFAVGRVKNYQSWPVSLARTDGASRLARRQHLRIQAPRTLFFGANDAERHVTKHVLCFALMGQLENSCSILLPAKLVWLLFFCYWLNLSGTNLNELCSTRRVNNMDVIHTEK